MPPEWPCVNPGKPDHHRCGGDLWPVLQANFGAEQCQELSNPSRVCWPGRRTHQVAFGEGGVNGNLRISAAGPLHLVLASRVGRAATTFEHISTGQQLG